MFKKKIPFESDVGREIGLIHAIPRYLHHKSGLENFHLRCWQIGKLANSNGVPRQLIKSRYEETRFNEGAQKFVNHTQCL